MDLPLCFIYSTIFKLSAGHIEMASAAQPLHNQLYINLIYGSGADIDLLIVLRQYKRRLDSYNIQQLVCCLRPGDGGAFHIGACRAYGNGKSSSVYLRVADCLSPGFIRRHVIPKQLAHPGDFGAAPAEVSRRLKGSYSRFGHKIIGIN